jgi:hypothetical protein
LGATATYGLLLLSVIGVGGVSAPVLLACLLLACCGLASEVAHRRGGHRTKLGLASVALLVAFAWHLLSLLPLPAGLLGAIAPANAALVGASVEATGGLWTAGAVSLAPGDTAIAAARLALVIVGVLFVTMARSRRATSERLLRVMLAAGAGVLLVVLGHAALPVDAIYGLVPAAGRGPSLVLGPFTNSNQLAAFCCALLPVVLVTAVAGPPGLRQGAWLMAPAIAGVAMLTLSRSATLGLGVGVGLTVLLLLLAGKRRPVAGLLVGAAGCGAALLMFASRLDPRAMLLVDASGLARFEHRLLVWSEAWRMAVRHWPTGVGGRAFSTAWYSVRETVPNVRAQDAEGLLPNLAATLGLPMTVLLVLVAGWVLGSLLKNALVAARADNLVPAGATAGLIALAAVSMFTMCTNQPGIALLAVYLYGAAGGGPALPLPSPLVKPIVGATVGLCGAVLLLWGGPRTLVATDGWFAPRLAGSGLAEGDDPLAVALRHPADPYGFAWSAILLKGSEPARSLQLVNRAMQLDPLGAEPHRAAVIVLLATGRPDHARIEVRQALAGATRDELPRFVEDALALFPDDATRLRLLPDDGATAVRVAREFTRQAGPELGQRAWLEVAGRSPPVFDAVFTAVRFLPADPEGQAVALAVEARKAAPEDRRYEFVEGEARIRAGAFDDGARLLRDLLVDIEALDDLWRGRALQLLAQETFARRPDSLGELLDLPSQGGQSEEALRAWVRGETFLAEGQVSRAVRELGRASKLRPDLRFLRERLLKVREQLR